MLWKIEKYCFQLCGYLPLKLYVLRYSGADGFGLLKQYLTGTVNGLVMSESFLLTGAILMEIPIEANYEIVRG